MSHYKNYLQRAEFVYTILYIQSPWEGAVSGKKTKWNDLKSARLKKIRGLSFNVI